MRTGSYTDFRRRLSAWFERDGRSLPWRVNRTPYRVWVSEIMLQQTTTETVRGYFDRFCARFPDIASLAAAPVSDVLKLWEGLGYYRRAVQMHRAAGVMAEKYHGAFPDSREAILALPGVGRYTAGAILSFAFDRREPILEANTLRLHARLLGLEEEVDSTDAQKRLWQFAEEILPTKRCGDFNQALIDLGNGVCLPKEPKCALCPLFTFCEAKRNGKVEQIPRKKPKPLIEARTETAFLVRESLFAKNSGKIGKAENCGESYGEGPNAVRFLLIRLPSGTRWAGLWDFPRFLCPDEERGLLEGTIFKGGLFEGEASEGRISESAAWRGLCALLGSERMAPGPILKTLRHRVTRYAITLPFREVHAASRRLPRFDNFTKNAKTPISLAAGTVLRGEIEFRWATVEQARQLAMNSTAAKLLRTL